LSEILARLPLAGVRQRDQVKLAAVIDTMAQMEKQRRGTSSCAAQPIVVRAC
jgi:hypothetical protein